MHPSTPAELGRLRDATFASLIDRLRADGRMRAAWLSGSHGRDEEDVWSDLDFHLAVDDSAFAAILQDPLPLFRLAGEPLLVQANFPSDSMPGGRFWLVVYAGGWHLDWNVGPVNAAVRPRMSRLLFEKLPVPVVPEPTPAFDAEAVRKALEFFWAMAPIAVKYAARGWTARSVQQIGLLSHAFGQLWPAAHGHPVPGQDTYHQNRIPPRAMLEAWPALGSRIDPSMCLEVISEFCVEVEELHAFLAERGVPIPRAMPAELRRLTQLAAAPAAAGQVTLASGRLR